MVDAVGSDWIGNWLPKSTAAYDPAFISKLARDFALPDIRIEEMARRLKTSGAIYLAQKHGARLPGVLGEWRLQMLRIQKLAAELEHDLATLERETDALFWAPQEMAEMQARILVAESRASSGKSAPASERVLSTSFGHTVRAANSENGAAIVMLDKNMMLETLRVLIYFGAAAVNEIASIQGKGGAPPRKALANWVGNIRTLWGDLLEQDFTMSYADGYSPALRFCIAAMGPLDEAVAVKSIKTLMSRLISESSKAAAPPLQTRKNLV